MSESVGTRQRANTSNIRQEGASETRTHTRDLGMSKRVVASITFTSADGRATGPNGTFTGVFVPQSDIVLIEGTNLNNGYFEILTRDATNAAFIRLDPPPKDEGPVTCEIRTA